MIEERARIKSARLHYSIHKRRKPEQPPPRDSPIVLCLPENGRQLEVSWGVQATQATLMTRLKASSWVNSIRYAVPILVTTDVLSLITLFHLGLCARLPAASEGKTGSAAWECGRPGDVSLC